ncbi:MAG: hypothetical protein GKR89_24335 [Candidatus Latescibacteria bacterium]|nr:hypothetical protein [Candidatus Latescibacterota bacterium]
MVRLAVVGVGWAGSRQVEAIAELGRKVEVDCLVDPDADFLREKSAQLGVTKTYTDFADVLADATIDAVSLCSPHPFHCQQALQAAQAGKHVLVEKPMAMDVDEATAMIAAAQDNGVKLYVAESASYEPVAHFLRGLLQGGDYIGELVSASLMKGFRAPQYSYPGRRAWLAEPDKGGKGTWTLHGIHTVGQLRYILGEVETVYMAEHKGSAYQRTDVEGTMSGMMTLESGVQVSVVQTPEVKLYGDLGGYLLHGDNGSIRAGDAGCVIFNDEHDGLRLEYPSAELSAYAQEIEAFADYIQAGVEGPTSGFMERRSVAVVQAGYESTASGQAVHLKQRFGAL